MAWKPSEISNQSGRTFVITGANGGLGEQTTKVLAGKGATVIMACRNAAKAQEVADRIDGDVRVAALDLADLASVRQFADSQGEFDVLINNAGLMNIPFSRTKDGFETQWGVNHLGHFALTGLLLDKIGDRVVTLASIAHKQTPKLWIDDLNYENRRYQRNLAYAQSKLSNLMFARELEHRLEAAGSTKRSYAVHPGVSATDLFARTETPSTKSPSRSSGSSASRPSTPPTPRCSRPPNPTRTRTSTGVRPASSAARARSRRRRRARFRGIRNCCGGSGRSPSV